MKNIIIKNVLIIGSGVMGSRIACYLSDVGLSVFLLDIIGNDKNRNSIVNSNLNKTIKSRPEPLLDKSNVHNITTGNIIDDINKIKDSDWIIEAVSEKENIKKEVLDIIEKNKKKESIVSTNTSGLSINNLVKGRSKEFKENFLGIHFFNPPRQLRLLEIIPNKKTKKGIIDFFKDYCSKILGKEVVLCKDTPGFIGNRVGVFSLMNCVHNAIKHKLSVGEVDALTGKFVFRPKSATFRTIDIIGLDTLKNLNVDIVERTNDINTKVNFKFPEALNEMYELGSYGDKSGKGFYQKRIDKNGKRKFLEINLKDKKYVEAKKIDNKKIVFSNRDPLTLINKNKKYGLFYQDIFLDLFTYCSYMIPKITDEIYKVDQTMKFGFGWVYGPFEIWDMMGVERVCKMIKNEKKNVSEWVIDMLKRNVNSFYGIEENKKLFYDLKTKKYSPIKEGVLYQTQTSYKKETLSYHSEDGIAHVKINSNLLDQKTLTKTIETLHGIENNSKGLVIDLVSDPTNQHTHSKELLKNIKDKSFRKVEQTISLQQKLSNTIKHFGIPTVSVASGFVVGQNLNLLMSSKNSCVYKETYMGLPELNLGIIPIGGSSKELLLTIDDEFVEGDPEGNRLTLIYNNFALKKISSSAVEGKNLRFLGCKDNYYFNPKTLVNNAKEKVKQIIETGYVSEPNNKKITARGRYGLSVLYALSENYRQAGLLTEHDKLVSDCYASVLCVGDISEKTKVDQNYFLEHEREVFLSLCSETKTIKRINYFLNKGSIIRN